MPTLRIRSRNLFIFGRYTVAFLFAAALCVACFAQQSEQSTTDTSAHPQFQPPQAPFTGVWRSIGPQPSVPAAGNLAGSSGNTSGRVTAIAIDPQTQRETQFSSEAPKAVCGERSTVA